MISVCIATFNGEKYIKQQIASILPQLTNKDEIIISDDGSTDNTIQEINSFESPIIHIYTNEGKHGYTPNFENALKHAKGDYIFIADQDDIWYSNKIKYSIEILKNYDLVTTDATIINADGKETGETFYAARKPKRGFIGNLIKFGYLGCCLAFKKKILKRAIPFPQKHKYCTHDNWLFIVAQTYYSVYISNKKMIYYRRHSQNASTGAQNRHASFSFRIAYRLYLCYQLMKIKQRH